MARWFQQLCVSTHTFGCEFDSPQGSKKCIPDEKENGVIDGVKSGRGPDKQGDECDLKQLKATSQ